jgi:hypothetical protein
MRLAAYLAPVVAAAAAVPLWLAAQHEPSFGLAVAIDRGSATRRGATTNMRGNAVAHRGDVARPTVQGSKHRAIWVYLDDRELLVACTKTGALPPGARCESSDDELGLQLPLNARGHYAILALGSSDLLPEPAATLDEAQALARTAGISTLIDNLDVD